MKKQFKSAALAAMALLLGAAANAQSFTIENLEGEQGKTIEIPVSMNNGAELEVTSFKFDLMFPEGVSAVVDEYGDIEAELSSRSQKHALATAITDEGAVRFVSYSAQNRSYKGTDGKILTLSVKLNGEPGEYSLRIYNALMTQAETFVDFDCPETTTTLTIKPDTATGIKSFSAASSDDCYDIAGRKVSPSQAGIYIQNGKKIVVK